LILCPHSARVSCKSTGKHNPSSKQCIKICLVHKTHNIGLLFAKHLHYLKKNRSLETKHYNRCRLTRAMFHPLFDPNGMQKESKLLVAAQTQIEPELTEN